MRPKEVPLGCATTQEIGLFAMRSILAINPWGGYLEFHSLHVSR
jgi:hypothetical protein